MQISNKNNPLSEAQKQALAWLRRSIDVNDGQGSAAFYSLTHRFWRLGWAKAYPETTGYIIETLLDYHTLTGEQWLKDYALRCADWIVGLQLPNGALPAGEVGSQNPSIFNTGQMLFGLARAYELTQSAHYYQAMLRAATWFCSVQEVDGSWQQGAYVQGHSPSYYTRAIWGVLVANRYLQNADIEAAMRLGLAYYAQRVLPNAAVEGWAFEVNMPAHTHTIAYTMRGFWECGLLLNDAHYQQIGQIMADALITQYEADNQRLAGSYDTNWKGDFSYICLTGQAQISLNLLRIYEVTGQKQYLQTAKNIFKTIENEPLKHRFWLPLRGAIAGSRPFNGAYMAWKYPNWAVKFYLDAARLLALYQEK